MGNRVYEPTMTDNELKAFLSNPPTPKTVHTVSLFDEKTGFDVCVEFIDGKPASATVAKGKGKQRVPHRIERCQKGWVIPDTWKQRQVILDVLGFIEILAELEKRLPK